MTALFDKAGVAESIMMKFLYICTHNRCRSILAEAITNHLSNGTLVAKSAGSQPVGEVHPLSLKYLVEAKASIEGLASQSWDDHEDWSPDVVITVCDSAAGEQCPVWFGDSLRVHWGLADPSRIDGTEKEIAQAFRNTIKILSNRIQMLLDANIEVMSEQEQARLFTDLSKT